jgi:hypothetical protein
MRDNDWCVRKLKLLSLGCPTTHGKERSESGYACRLLSLNVSLYLREEIDVAIHEASENM